jgi:hypothetical protein
MLKLLLLLLPHLSLLFHGAWFAILLPYSIFMSNYSHGVGHSLNKHLSTLPCKALILGMLCSFNVTLHFQNSFQQTSFFMYKKMVSSFFMVKNLGKQA